ncbi:NUDIX domain-containing protein [Candidatus Pacearchaeota archaeon]|nr:NUDIX domain-containing protein [Candidatus Pacearchaeota archaeon]
MTRVSAGLLMFRIKDKLEVFLAHHGGPFWKDKDIGSWTIPKGEVEKGEELLETAKREFEEETGIVPEGEFIFLGDVKQKSGKIVHAWAFKKDWSGLLRLNYITVEISGNKMKIPEIDKAQYFTIEKAKEKINPAQKEFLERLEKLIF